MSWARRLTIGLLGVALIVDSFVENFRLLPFTVGLVMVGLIPVDLLIDLTRPSRNNHDIDRLREGHARTRPRRRGPVSPTGAAGLEQILARLIELEAHLDSVDRDLGTLDDRLDQIYALVADLHEALVGRDPPAA